MAAHEFAVVDPATRTTVGETGPHPNIGYSSGEWTEWLWRANRVRLAMTARAANNLSVDVGMLLVSAERDLVFVVDQVSGTVTETTSQVEVSAVEPVASDDDVGWRIAVPDAGQSHDVQSAVSAETAIKHYVDNHYGAGAVDVARRLPVELSVAADLGRGATGTWRGRYQRISDLLELIGQSAGVGWRTTWDWTARRLVFDVVAGVAIPHRLSVADGTVAEETFLRTIRGVATYAYVAGQGVGAARTIVERNVGISTPSGWARRELFVDARDTDDAATLEQRGDDELASAQQPDAFEVDVSDVVGRFSHPTDWDIGDTAVYEPTFGAARTVRVVGATTAVEQSTVATRRAHLDRPWPKLGDTDNQSGGTQFE